MFDSKRFILPLGNEGREVALSHLWSSSLPGKHDTHTLEKALHTLISMRPATLVNITKEVKGQRNKGRDKGKWPLGRREGQAWSRRRCGPCRSFQRN